MTTLEIPIVAGATAFTERAELEGVSFNLRFRWNDRAEVWFLDILDAEGNDVLLGLALVTGVAVNLGMRHVENAPDGIIHLYDTEGTLRDPGVDELGQRVKVFFTPYADLEAA